MSSTKKKLLEEIDRKVARKKEMAARAVERNTIDAFVLAFIANIEEINTMTSNTQEWVTLAFTAQRSLRGQLCSIDERCEIEVSWVDKESPKPQINGVLIRWSENYQIKNSCEPELFVDITSLLFK